MLAFQKGINMHRFKFAPVFLIMLAGAACLAPTAHAQDAKARRTRQKRGQAG